MFKLNPLQRRRWNNFRSNRRAYWSSILFAVLCIVSMAAEFVANDRPIVLSHQGEWMFPAFGGTYEEADFGGDPGFVADFTDPVVQCLVVAAGVEDCFDTPEDTMAAAQAGALDVEAGWMIWPPIPYSFNTINYDVLTAPSPPDAEHWLGTDDQTRDVLARAHQHDRGGVVLFAEGFHQFQRLAQGHPGLQRPLRGQLDRRAVGHRVGEGQAQFDHVDPGAGQAAHDIQRGVVVRVAGHDVCDEGLAPLAFQLGETCLDPAHARPSWLEPWRFAA